MSHRSRKRAVVDDPAIAEVLWRTLAPAVGAIGEWFADPRRQLEPSMDHWHAVGCNPRTRFYYYGLGGDFLLHEDEAWKPAAYVRSMLTILVYLPTEACVGGETVIDGEVVKVEPWRVAIFDHRLKHEGKPVEGGTKLVLRNDVVASARGPSYEYNLS